MPHQVSYNRAYANHSVRAFDAPAARASADSGAGCSAAGACACSINCREWSTTMATRRAMRPRMRKCFRRRRTRIAWYSWAIPSPTPGAAARSFLSGKPYINRGISGQVTPQMLLRFYQDVIALKPKVVIILAGTNDIAGNVGPMTMEATENYFLSMADMARANNIRIVLSLTDAGLRLHQTADGAEATRKDSGTQPLAPGLRREEQLRLPGLYSAPRWMTKACSARN